MTEPHYLPRRAVGPYPVDNDDDSSPTSQPTPPPTESSTPAPAPQPTPPPTPARSTQPRWQPTPTVAVPSWYGQSSDPAPRPASPATPVRWTPEPIRPTDPAPPPSYDPVPPAPGAAWPIQPATAPEPPQLDLFARLASVEARPTAPTAPTAPSAPPAPTAPTDRGEPSTPTGTIAPIEFRGLTKRFGSVLAVDQVTFTVRPGRVTGFLGPNGAGKTTTLRMLVGLATPTAGSATFGQQTYPELEQPQQTVGTALDASFHPGRTGRDHLRVLAATAGVGDSRVDELLELVDLTPAARRKAGGYSMGMRQRLSLASALLGDPDYLILDEPANGLDPEGIRWLRGFLRSYAARGKVVLVSSHMLGEVQETVDDVAVIGRGRLLRNAPIDQIEVAEPTTRVRTAQPARTAETLVGQGFAVQTGSDADGDYVRVQSPDAARIGAVLLEHRIAVIELTRERFNLEESFFRMLEHQAGITAPPTDRSAS